MKKVFFVLFLFIIIAGTALYWVREQGKKLLPLDARNTTYLIDNTPVTLIQGTAETEAAPGSASKIITKYFGNEARGDLNGDGFDDLAFLITRTGGGSGTFFYVVVALNTPDGYRGTNAVFLGDRISPQTSEIRGNELIVNYATRNPDEPMTTSPSVGVSKYFRIENGSLIEITKPLPPTVQLFYYSEAQDTDSSGSIQCSKAGLVPVNRQLPPTQTLLADTINALLHASTTPEEVAQGLASHFPLPGVALTESSLKDGVLTLTFADPEHKTSGGACRAGILRAQIEATAKQFKDVSEVKVLPEDLFQP